VYIAGPYRRPDPVSNTRAAISYGLGVWEAGAAVPLIPHLTMLADLVCPRPEHYWLRLDDAQLSRCDALIRRPGASVGSDNEVELAQRLGLPVYFEGTGFERCPSTSTLGWLRSLFATIVT
jgi:hypothetical protein